MTVTAQTCAARFPHIVEAVLDSDHTKISGHPEGQFSITLLHAWAHFLKPAPAYSTAMSAITSPLMNTPFGSASSLTCIMLANLVRPRHCGWTVHSSTERNAHHHNDNRFAMDCATTSTHPLWAFLGKKTSDTQMLPFLQVLHQSYMITWATFTALVL